MVEDLLGRRLLAAEDVGVTGDERRDAAGRVGDHIRHGRAHDDLAALAPRARADLEQPVGLAQQGGVVVDDQHRVAVGQQIPHDAQKPVDVGRMQADAGLVEDVEHPGGAVAHGAGELDALALPGGQGRRCAIQRQVPQAELEQAAGGDGQLVDDLAGHGDEFVRHGPRYPGGPFDEVGQGEAAGLVQAEAAHRGGARRL